MKVSDNELFRRNWIQEQLSLLENGSSILDAGAGEQQYKKFCTHLNYTSQDFAEYNPESVLTGLQMDKWDYGNLDIISDIANIPRPDASFDAILCAEVFEHIPNPLAALKEFSRLLKPNGKLIITAPFCSITHFAPYHFSTGFSRFYYQHHLPLNGFEIIKLVPNGNYFSFMQQEVDRIPFLAMDRNLKKPSRIQFGALKIVIKMLRKYANVDNKSSELLCFGWHSVSKKIN